MKRRWLRLVGRRLGPLELEIELVVVGPLAVGPGIWSDDLVGLFIPGDRCTLVVQLAAHRNALPSEAPLAAVGGAG